MVSAHFQWLDIVPLSKCISEVVTHTPCSKEVLRIYTCMRLGNRHAMLQKYLNVLNLVTYISTSKPQNVMSTRLLNLLNLSKLALQPEIFFLDGFTRGRKCRSARLDGNM